MKKKSKDIKSFVENIRLKSTYCKINISQIEEFMMEVGIHFIGEKSMENREFLNLLVNSLYGLCPNCGIKTTGDVLWTVCGIKNQTINTIDVPTLMMGGQIAIKQLVKGKCVKLTCNSKKIEIHWEYMKGWKEIISS